MLKLDLVVDQILKNCDISDAQNAGLYSICGLALRLRDLYKWEHGLPPWEEKDSSEILTWIGQKEEIWENLTEMDFNHVSIQGKSFDPFDTLAINNVLMPYGFYYGAGLARSLKPTFFLAAVKEKTSIDGHQVLTLGRELARDLLTIPALCQDQTIVLRSESACMYLWDQMMYIKKSGKKALKIALKHCGISSSDPKTWRAHLLSLFETQRNTYVRHEFGELKDTVFNPEIWQSIIASYPHTAVELVARSLKDLLADTCEVGPVRYFIRTKNVASLAFYVAFFDGLRKEIFTEMRPAFDKFIENQDWDIIEEAVATGYNAARTLTELMIKLYNEAKKISDDSWFEKQIDAQILAPLGCAVHRN
jgi:hypothetical protein